MLKVLVPVTLLVTLHVASSCNEAICGPIVTKCQLLKYCSCEMPSKHSHAECDCCASCASCLGDKYSSCCSCVGMCEPPDHSDGMTNSSSVEDLREPIPGLFDALTSANASNSWTVFRYPAYESLLHHKGLGFTVDKEKNLVEISWKNEILSTGEIKNCSVAFIKECMALDSCKGTCRAMGAAKFRWFHDQGCCECVGDTCIDYGKNFPMCEKCTSVPYEKDEL